MVDQISETTIRGWLDDELISSVQQMTDSAAEFNLLLEISNLNIHLIRRQSDGPILLGQEISYDNEIKNRIQELSIADRDELVARIRETLTAVPIVYGFTNSEGVNVQFQDMDHIFIESRIYPDELTQGRVMQRLISVWKAMRYLDDLPRLIEAIERNDV
jgi:hypothetical protein